MDRPADFMDALIRYEDGRLSEDEMIRLFQYVIDNGLDRQLQGQYGRVARRLIDVGLCTPPRSKEAGK